MPAKFLTDTRFQGQAGPQIISVPSPDDPGKCTTRPVCSVPFPDGHTLVSIASIAKGIHDWPIGCYLTEIPTMELCRTIFGPPDAEIRKLRSKVFYENPHGKARDRLRLGMHDRGEEYVFANGRIWTDDLPGHKRHLPAHVKIIRLEEYTIHSNEIFDISTSYSEWKDLHFREELYVYVHINRLIVEPGAVIEIYGNVLTLICDEVVLRPENTLYSADSEKQETAFRIRILGTRHLAFSGVRRFESSDGYRGEDGQKGVDSYATQVVGTPFGPQLDIVSDNLNGEDGQNGRDGGSGTHGQNGGMAMLADLRFGSVFNFKPGSLEIFVQAGQGMAGGHGGDGGSGGDGGNASEGIGLKNPGGRGGSGGNGGNGGYGGNGGNGGLSSNIFIQIPFAMKNCLTLRSVASKGGAGGKGGEGGKPGKKGMSDRFYIENRETISGCTDGKSGRRGRDGRQGKSRQGSAIHVFTEKDLPFSG